MYMAEHEAIGRIGHFGRSQTLAGPRLARHHGARKGQR